MISPCFILSELVAPLISHMEKALPNTKSNALLLLLLSVVPGTNVLESILDVSPNQP
jgi:hypothetical protein